ncbi:uncharacterized protein HMPREF1541_01220 [Cyphellophora europaea CBS 101466]|uniref:N-acetyltransferase domain-containing protein n=1 Tax=Cyphellophora europaea (strain CBS 101466) TaxID=1220924 RepID=W2SEH9_CYPE1|nr:uncharacterized protein HMPREF1541_01220 [Cyphellophora europaea CBS 101466]ETN47030.1 hypothetical protein HMPREF1541_01220 [Cyphellophora europaea CBS 101466]
MKDRDAAAPGSHTEKDRNATPKTPGGQVHLDTSRLVLRAARTEDAESLNEAFKDPEVMRYWSEPAHSSKARTEEWVSGMVGGSQNGLTDFVICLKPDMMSIGKIGVWQDQEIGFLLAKRHWGKGLAFEALQIILPYLFGTAGFSFLTADIDPRNKASEGLLRKVGFELDGYQERSMQIGNEWVDSQYLKLTKARWEQICLGAATDFEKAQAW